MKRTAILLMLYAALALPAWAQRPTVNKVTADPAGSTCTSGSPVLIYYQNTGTEACYCNASNQYACVATGGGHSDGANCSAGNYPLGVDADGAVQTCTADDDSPDSDGEVPDDITVTSTSAGSFGSTLDVLTHRVEDGPWCDVTHATYGATPDAGSAGDDSNPVETAFSSCAEGNIYFPEGAYDMNGSWNTPGPTGVVHVRGAGIDKTVLTGDGVSGFINPTTTGEVFLEDLTLTSWNNIINLDTLTGTAARIHLRNVKVTSSGALIEWDTVGGSAAVTNLILEGVECHSMVNCVNVAGPIENAVVTRSLSDTSSGAAFAFGNNTLANQSGYQALLFTGNTVISATDYGVLSYFLDARILGNKIQDTTGAGEVHGIYTKSQGAVVSNNRVVGFSGGTSHKGISIKGDDVSGGASTPLGYEVSVVSNTIDMEDATSSVCIRVQQERVSVGLNVCSQFTTDGLTFDNVNGVGGSISFGNQISTDNDISSNSGAGIRMASDGDDDLVSLGDTVQGAETGIYIAGTSAVSSYRVQGASISDGQVGIDVNMSAALTLLALKDNQIRSMSTTGIRHRGTAATQVDQSGNQFLSADPPVTYTVTPSRMETHFAGEIVANRVLQPGGNLDIVVTGDSIAADTPLQNAPFNGIAGQLMHLFAQDPDYTTTTGSELVSTQGGGSDCFGTDSSDWNLANATCSGGVLTMSGGTALGYYGSRAIYQPNTSPNGITLDGSKRYLVRVDMEFDGSDAGPPVATANENGSVSIVTTTAGSTNEASHFWLEVEADDTGTSEACNNQAWSFAFDDAPNNGGVVSTKFIGAQYDNTSLYFLIEPAQWTADGSDWSTEFSAAGAGTGCRAEFWFVYNSDVTSAAQQIIINDFDVYEVTDSVMVWRFGDGSETLQGWWNATDDDYDDIVTTYLPQTDAMALVIGRNDYDGQTGDDGSASTRGGYFDALAAIKAQATTDGIELIKVLPFPSTATSSDGGDWGGLLQTSNWGWQFAQVAERDYLWQNGWNWIDVSKWWTYSMERQINNVLINGDQLPDGATEKFPIFITGNARMYKAGNAKIYSNTATSGSDGSNRYCFNIVKEGSSPVDLMSSDQCTDDTELSTTATYNLALNQNTYVSTEATAFSLEITEAGTPTDLSGAQLVVQLMMEGCQNQCWENQFMVDDQHPSMLSMRHTAEALYRRFTGRAPNGAQ